MWKGVFHTGLPSLYRVLAGLAFLYLRATVVAKTSTTILLGSISAGIVVVPLVWCVRDLIAV